MREAVDTLSTHDGKLRERFRLVDPAALALSPDELPDRAGIREHYAELTALRSRVKPRAGEGTVAAWIRGARLATLEHAARLRLALNDALSRGA